MSAALVKYELDRPALTVITSETQLDRYTHALIELEERGHLSSEDKEYARLLAALIEKYENEKYPVAASSPQEVLTELIEQNGLRQKDLVPLLGTESVVSEIKSGKRRLSVNNIAKLSQRFRVSPAVFFPKVGSRRPK